MQKIQKQIDKLLGFNSPMMWRWRRMRTTARRKRMIKVLGFTAQDVARMQSYTVRDLRQVMLAQPGVIDCQVHAPATLVVEIILQVRAWRRLAPRWMLWAWHRRLAVAVYAALPITCSTVGQHGGGRYTLVSDIQAYEPQRVVVGHGLRCGKTYFAKFMGWTK